MAFSGEVTKTYIVVKPEAAAAKERVSQLKATLIDASFIVVREEFRDISAELATPLLKDETDVTTSDIVGRCFLFVLALCGTLSLSRGQGFPRITARLYAKQH